METMMSKFQEWCGLPNVRGAINSTHMSPFQNPKLLLLKTIIII
jgi:hypothetical protein